MTTPKCHFTPSGARPSDTTRHHQSARWALAPVAMAALFLAAAPARGALLITEVMSSGSVADWFELTNTGTSVIDLTGYKMDDSSFATGSAVPLVGVTHIAPGESVLFVEGNASTASSLRTSWNNCLGNLRIGSYTGSGVGLGSGGDGVAVFDSTSTEQTRQSFGAATSNTTFYFTANNSASNLSVNGSNGASSCANNSNVGSPGISDSSVTAPGTPTVGTATSVGQNGFTAQWTAPASGGTATGYVVEVSADSFATILQTLVVDNTTHAAVTGLTANTPYSYRVHAVNRGGIGSLSGNQAVTTLAGNTSPTTSLIDQTALSGVAGDATDPMAVSGIDFTVGDDFTSLGNLTVSATSSNTAVVPNDTTHLVLTRSGSSVNLKVVPAGVGYTDITVAITDDDASPLSVSRTLRYAASAHTGGTSGTRWYTGRSDASSALPLSDGTTLLVVDDEAPAPDASGAPVTGGNALYAYGRTVSGAPLKDLAADTLGAGLGLANANLQTYAQCVAAGYTGIRNDNCKADGEMDLEASFMLGNRAYFSGSHSNNKSGHSRPDRWRLFAADVSGGGVSTSLTLLGYYQWLREDLRQWDQGNGHGLGADYLGLVASSNGGAGQEPEKATLDGFSIEGMATSPDDAAAWLAFRAPLVAAPGQPAVTPNSATGRVHALIVPVTNYAALGTASAGGTAGSATLGAPIRLDLGGRGIREIRKNAVNQYLIMAGPPDGATGTAPHDFRLYSWDGSVDGNGQATNLFLRDADLSAFTAPAMQCSAEGLVAPSTNLNGAGTVDIVSDCGDAVLYGDSTAAKDLTYNEWKKFRVDSVAYSSITQTISFAALSDKTLGTPPFTVSASGGPSGNPVQFSSLTPAVCQVNGNLVNLATVGTCTLRASQAGNSSYLAASPVDRGFNVSLPNGTGGTIGSGGLSGSVAGGGWVFAPVGTGAGQTGGFIPVTGHAKSPPSLPSGQSFLHGLVDFVLLNGTVGSTATVSMTYPSALPANTLYWKYGATTDNGTPHWYTLPEGTGPGTFTVSSDRRTITLTLADGGLGDSDVAANGIIVDPSGPAVPSASVQSVPTLGFWSQLMLSGGLPLAAMGWGARRKRRHGASGRA